MKRKCKAIISLVLCAVMFFGLGGGGTPLNVEAAESSSTVWVYTYGTSNEAQTREVLELVNQERAAAGVDPLVMTDLQEEMAIQRAFELTVLFSHTRPDGRDCFSLSDDVGLTSTALGENIAAGQPNAQLVMYSWMNSEGHRENILNPNYTHIGIACVQMGGINYWVQYFTGNPSDTTPAAATGQDGVERDVIYPMDPDFIEAQVQGEFEIQFLEPEVDVELGSSTVLDPVLLLESDGQLYYYGVIANALVEPGNGVTISDDAPLTVDKDGMIVASEQGKTGTYTLTVNYGGMTATKTVRVTCSHPAEGQITTRVEPECGEDGYVKVECGHCGAVLSEEVLPATGEHDMSAWTTVKEADCTHDGSEERTCSICGFTETRVIEALGHDPVENVLEEAGCLTEGSVQTVCDRCGAVLSTETVPALGHDWSDWDVVTKATWDEDGLRVRKCERCGREESEVIPAESKNHEHDFTGKETILTEPDCTHPGEKEVACINPNCDAVKKVDIPALGHDWSEWQTVTEPQWETEGLERRTCSRCDAVEEQVIPTLESTHVHDFSGEGTILEEPTCTEAGSRKVVCSEPLCGEEQIIAIPATGHTAGEWEVVKEATCTEKGEQIQKCTVCGEIVATREIPVKAHNYGEWKTVKNATSTEEGLRQRVCADCGYVESQTIAKLPAASTGNQSGQGGQIGTAANNTSGNAQNGAVKTGDNSSVFVWMTVAGAAVVLGAGALGLRRKFRR